MQVNVSGKGVDVGESLRHHMEARLESGVGKYSDRMNGIKAVVSKEAHLFRIDISGNIGTHEGHVIRAVGSADEVYAAFDLAAGKIEKQLRRYKRRLTNRHSESEKVHIADIQNSSLRGIKYVIADHEEAPEKESPIVIAEKATDIDTLTVSQAVMKMDLSDLPALMFLNRSTGRFNVVYRRHDGNISWVDPAEVQEAAA